MQPCRDGCTCTDDEGVGASMHLSLDLPFMQVGSRGAGCLDVVLEQSASEER